jgi:biopolymer transport protein ExbD
MGISMGKKGDSVSEPNIVPLIDILLVLIIIFMVVSPLTPKGLDALVPQSPDPSINGPIVSTVVIQLACTDATCLTTSVMINEEESNWEALGLRLENIFKTRAEKIAFVKGETNVMWAHVARAIDVAKAAGVDMIGLLPGETSSRPSQT